ncbi:unnamed protein product [Lactuca virosa]|uniref:Uncharacterized protein n=1 Tax=Lactuca virosa TaxID=75947 RepID=A0AAU9P6W7_9ASTR|nr:unnamed protein product [Lactuca virosa]
MVQIWSKCVDDEAVNIEVENMAEALVIGGSAIMRKMETGFYYSHVILYSGEHIVMKQPHFCWGLKFK